MAGQHGTRSKHGAVGSQLVLIRGGLAGIGIRKEARKIHMGATATWSRVEREGKDKRLADPCIVVVFGASGDLTKRKLLPALFHLKQAGLLREESAVVGVARRDLSETFVPDMKDGVFKGGASRKPILGLIPFLNG